LGVARGRISHFPIDLRRRPYNTRTVNTRTTVRVCDYTNASRGLSATAQFVLFTRTLQ